MSRLSVLSLGLLILLAACQPAGEPQRSLPRFEPVAASEDFPVQVPSSFASTRGWLVVAEDRTDPHAPEIRLPVAIVHNRSGRDGEPVLYLAGGPGASGLPAAAYPGAYPWLEDRDFIVFGQRGTASAQPALMCPEYRDAVSSGSDLAAAVRQCRDRMAASGIGVEHYNSPSSVADLEDLRQVLQIETWNFYAVSYGTRLALSYARDHSARLRAMVLDSPLPPNAIYDDESAVNFEAALRAIATDCAAQPACAAAYPDLETRFFDRIETSTRAPFRMEGVEEPVTGADLAALIVLSSGRDVIAAPGRMDAVANLDPGLAAALSRPRAASNLAWGMRLSVWCREALPFSDRSRRSQAGPALGGYESAAIRPELCAAWDVAPLGAEVVAPVVSEVPTLIVAGEFDPLTPPAWGLRAAETLANSRVVSVRGEAHNPTQQWGGDGCAMSLVGRFIETPDAMLSAAESELCVFARPAPRYALPGAAE